MVSQLNAELVALQAEKKLVLKELPYLQKVTTAIPPTEDPPNIVDQLSTLADKTHCKLGSVNPADVVSPSGTVGLSIIPVTFTVSGTHQAVFVFLKDFYTLQRLMTISTVALAPGGTSPNILAVGDGQPYTLSVSATAYTTYVPPVATP
jgi:Tfp pilus assembly protein PilO